MSTRGRRWLLVSLVLALVAVGLFAWGCLPGESAATAAAGRVPAGAGRAAVEAAVGRPADRVITNARGDAIGAALIWQFGEDQLWVEFDKADRVTAVTPVVTGRSPWDQFRAWLGF
jgi:hypothetical protein